MRTPMMGFPGQPMHQMGQNPGMSMQMGPNMAGPHMGNVMSPGMMNHPPPNGMVMGQLPQQVRLLCSPVERKGHADELTTVLSDTRGTI